MNMNPSRKILDSKHEGVSSLVMRLQAQAEIEAEAAAAAAASAATAAAAAGTGTGTEGEQEGDVKGGRMKKNKVTASQRYRSKIQVVGGFSKQTSIPNCSVYLITRSKTATDPTPTPQLRKASDHLSEQAEQVWACLEEEEAKVNRWVVCLSGLH
jgi:hypothetical protein